ncbi:MAG: hypothetical protein HOY78_23615 [Saccharothrix sp.]|nr:hypothetical protein [Saccharothrix sp.]
MTAERIDATGLGIGVAVPGASGTPSLLTRLPSATLTHLCQSMTIDVPVLGPRTAVLRARTARAGDLVLDMTSVSGNLDADDLLIGPLGGDGAGYRSGPIVLHDVVIRTGSISAGSFEIDGLDLTQHDGDHACPTGTNR